MKGSKSMFTYARREGTGIDQMRSAAVALRGTTVGMGRVGGDLLFFVVLCQDGATVDDEPVCGDLCEELQTLLG